MRTIEAPETLEGWYVQHDVYTVNWPQWRAVAPSQRAAMSAASTAWCTAQATPTQGSSAFFSVLGQKGDLLAVHFRPVLRLSTTSNSVYARRTSLPIYSLSIAICR